jgi:hypothetical protein
MSYLSLNTSMSGWWINRARLSSASGPAASGDARIEVVRDHMPMQGTAHCGS